MKVINGEKFKMLLISAANNLYNHYPEIDALNVFPVPDGDTGMNMNLTLSSGAKEILNRNDTSVYEICKVFSRGLLMGARGNSGVITSQIFRGLSQSFDGKETINAIDLANGFDNGRKVAYKAVVKPVEGTILTVIRESSSVLIDKVTEKTSIEEALDIILKEARASLARTPNLLPVLKEVGVVDSGGAGLVKILEGMDSAAHGEFIQKNEATALDANKSNVSENVNYDINFKLLLGPKDNKNIYQKTRFFNVLNSRGNNLKIDQNDNILDIHIESENVGEIISFAENYGEFISLSIFSSLDNANRTKNTEDNKTSNNGLNGDDLKIDKEYALVATSSGSGIDKFFNDVGVNYIVPGGQTMNPSTEDFVKIIKGTHAKTVYVFPNNGNIIMAANQARDVLKDKINVIVIPTKTIMQGIVSSMMFSADVDTNENIKEMENAIKSVKSGCVTFAIKDTDINGVHVKKDEFMAIKESKDILFSCKSKIDALIGLLDEMVNEDTAIITILFGNDVTKEEEEMVSDYIKSKYSDCDLDLRRGEQPIYSFLVGIE